MLTFEFTDAQCDSILAETGQDTSRLAVKWYNATSKAWENVQTSVSKDARTVSAAVEHFSTFGVFIDSEAPEVTPSVDVTLTTTTPPPTTPPATPEEPGEFPWMIVIIVVIIILIAGGAYYYTRKP